MVRADYCYNGQSWTKPGIALKVEDIWNINDPDPGREIEAVWGADGLICANRGRHVKDIKCPGLVIPTCNPKLLLAEHDGGLFMTRFPGSTLDKARP